MKLMIQRIPPGTSASRTASPPPGTLQFRFGDEVLIASEGAAGERVRARDGRVIEGDVPAENLHLVVQLGNLFQRLNPDVRVLVDKGRYLVVDLPPERVAEVARREGCCFAVRPLRESRTVFEIRPPGARRAAAREAIQVLTARLTREEVEADLRHLVSFGTRHSISSQFVEAASWARGRLESMGYLTRVETVQVGAAGRSLNVVAEQPGLGAGPRGVVLVTAHLDSVNEFGSASSPAPGADDNGSGSAGVLAIARALAGHRATHDLRLILFGGEEQGLFGSLQHVAGLPADERARIRAVVNMDMVATRNTESASVLIEGGAGVSQATIDGLAAAAETYTSLIVQTSLHPFNSDHVPFIEAGIPAVLTIEGADQSNPNVHTAGDTLDHIDFDLFLQILTMNVAFVAETLGEAQEGRDRATAGGCGVTVPLGGNLVEALRSLPFQLSGRYAYNGGANLRQGRSFVDPGTRTSAAALGNPLYRLDEPVYLEARAELETSARSTQPLRFTLHVDVDGADPLGAVSGTVALGASAPGEASPHFIGRVDSDETTGGGRLLTVSDIRFRWPDSNDIITRLTVELSGSPLAIPAAKITFHESTGDRAYGPYVASQESIYFREVEMDVDREVNAIECEPLDTHVHPDRPADVPQEVLSLESAFAKAGIRITRSPGSGTVVNQGAGNDKRWSYSELHDSMEKHWVAYANRPQWKMWIFLAELGESDDLGGVMFDSEIDEPGGVDRQGTAIFTRCPYFHTEQGGYIEANPPGPEAIRRELFFNLMHETGHAFNLAHSFDKELENHGWAPPAWMPLRDDPQALSWMNYPDAATPGGNLGGNATWFYRRFRFRFDPGELLFLRHAPETYVQMGGQAWFEQHGRVARISLDPRLELILRSRKTVSLWNGKTASEVELGEPVLLELRLRNAGGQPVLVHGNLDPSDGLVELAVTNPKGERRPFLPIDHTRTRVIPRLLQPDERIYQSLDLTMGSFGFPFKEPGPYRVEASYRNLDGSTAAAVLQVYVRPARTPDVVPVVNELFDARVGRTLYVEGTREMEDVNDKMDWVRGRLKDLIGEQNPISIHLRTVRYKPLARVGKLIDPISRRLEEKPEQPDVVAHELKPVVVDHCEQAADTMGHIWYGEVLNSYARAAEDANAPDSARVALQQTLRLFQARGVVQPVLQALEERIREVGGGPGRSRPARGSAARKGRKAETSRSRS